MVEPEGLSFFWFLSVHKDQSAAPLKRKIKLYFVLLAVSVSVFGGAYLMSAASNGEVSDMMGWVITLSLLVGAISVLAIVSAMNRIGELNQKRFWKIPTLNSLKAPKVRKTHIPKVKRD